MGLFDDVFKNNRQTANEYREHLENLKAQHYMEVEQRRITAAQQQAQYNMALGMGAQQPPKAIPRFDPNKSEAFQIPLSQAVTMWQVKHGDKWYDAHHARPPAGDDFYTDVFDRIKQAGLFESIDGWYRLKENVENLLANN